MEEVNFFFESFGKFGVDFSQDCWEYFFGDVVIFENSQF